MIQCSSWWIFILFVLICRIKTFSNLWNMALLPCECITGMSSDTSLTSHCWLFSLFDKWLSLYRHFVSFLLVLISFYLSKDILFSFHLVPKVAESSKWISIEDKEEQDEIEWGILPKSVEFFVCLALWVPWFQVQHPVKQEEWQRWENEQYNGHPVETVWVKPQLIIGHDDYKTIKEYSIQPHISVHSSICDTVWSICLCNVCQIEYQ